MSSSGPVPRHVRLTVSVQVRHFGVAELRGDVGVPEEALQDEHGQTHGVVVALQRDQLPEDGLKAAAAR